FDLALGIARRFIEIDHCAIGGQRGIDSEVRASDDALIVRAGNIGALFHFDAQQRGRRRDGAKKKNSSNTHGDIVSRRRTDDRLVSSVQAWIGVNGWSRDGQATNFDRLSYPGRNSRATASSAFGATGFSSTRDTIFSSGCPSRSSGQPESTMIGT